MRSGIIAGGNWIVDHVKIIDRWPAQDTLVSILRQSSSNGGAPYNVLKDLRALGATFPLEAIGLVGDDSDGQSILEDCRAHQIDIGQLRRCAATTSYSDVMTVQATGRRTFFHQRGANARLDHSHFDFTQTRAKIFHLGYLLLLDALDAIDAEGMTGAATILQQAKANGLHTSLDCVSDQTGRFQAVAQPALPHVDYFFANDFEASQLTGISLLDDEARNIAKLRDAAQCLLSTGVKGWVFVHSPHGVYAASSSAEHWHPSVQVPPDSIKGAAGAGDALAAGILYGLHEGWPIMECLRLGVTTAAASLSDATCSAGVRSAHDCLILGEQFGFNE